VRKWLLRGESQGGSARLLKELAAEDHPEYRSFMRMTPDRFEELLQKVSGVIQRSDTVMRGAIPATVKLELVLSYLATGNNYRSLSHFFGVSKSAISLFTPEVMDAIYHFLKEYIKTR
jgi:hypothetical protein